MLRVPVTQAKSGSVVCVSSGERLGITVGCGENASCDGVDDCHIAAANVSEKPALGVVAGRRDSFEIISEGSRIRKMR